MDGPVGGITGDPLFRAKATLVALSRSSGPGVENRGRSAAIQIFPSLSLARERASHASSRHSLRALSFRTRRRSIHPFAASGPP